MYVSNIVNVFGAAVGLLPLFVSAAPATPIVKRVLAPSGPGNQFLGSLTWYPQQPDLILATVSNNSTQHYAILTKNNLFDDLHPYRPLQVATTSGGSVALIGTRHPYPNIEDAQFRDFPPGTAWERYFNMSAYMPPMANIQTQQSQCFTFQLPKYVEALEIDDTQTNQHLADIFLRKGISQVELVSTPIHQNVTVTPGTPGTATTAALGAEVSIPAELQAPGVFLPPSVQAGQVVNPLQGLTPVSTGPGFIINAKKYSNVVATAPKSATT